MRVGNMSTRIGTLIATTLSVVMLFSGSLIAARAVDVGPRRLDPG